MDSTPFTNSHIVAAFEAKTRISKARHQRGLNLFPSGVVHDSRHMSPYPLYVEHALGSRKWDADGNELIDFYGGHGSLLLGHAHPSLVQAVNDQIALGTHPAACHELELTWAELVQQLIPTAERIRFTSSGTEANLLAIRLARAFTGRTKLLRFKNHFHGWQDHVAFGSKFHSGTANVPGIVPGIVDAVIVADPADPEGVKATLESDDDIAAVILEPTGASSGQMPLGREFTKMLREVTQARGTLLIFDEVVTGFRVSPGGVQAAWGILPDLTGLAKILAGGLPGGAVVGRKEIMAHLDFEAANQGGFEKIPHQGTFNANPLSAAAGVAMLSRVAEGDVTAQANEQGDKLKAAWNAVFAAENVPWAAMGLGSNVYIFTNPDGLNIDPESFDAAAQPLSVMEAAGNHPAAKLFRLAMLVNGVDLSSKPGAIVSAVHSDADIAESAEALRASLAMLREEGHV
ncbi:MAG: aminotransferase class III-fold pyridoxal phosphate-dependent enzyme [Rhodospirillaceae bacterium]|jgi:glutamate-1-semialdehyde 2,1-aminomutase|nr:aminotransferase class III-fold pyridoxal phosphate-dependent enzyme [Rhodospirillaceae bacterium]